MELELPDCTPADAATVKPTPTPPLAPRHTTPLSDIHMLPPHALSPILTRALLSLDPSPPRLKTADVHPDDGPLVAPPTLLTAAAS